MIHLKRIKVKESPYFENSELLKGLEFECSDVNLFVGDQGTGKSSLLRMLSQNSSKLELELSAGTLARGIKSYYFDTEKDNPRINDPQLYTTPGGKDTGIGFRGALASRFQSHGEVLSGMVLAPLMTAKNCVVLLDEPESGLSVRNQLRLITAINKAVKSRCQIFIATHNVLLIEAYEVISLDHKCRMSGKDYIKGVKHEI